MRSSPLSITITSNLPTLYSQIVHRYHEGKHKWLLYVENFLYGDQFASVDNAIFLLIAQTHSLPQLLLYIDVI